MELAEITAQQVAVLFLLIFTGFIGVKTGVLKMEGKKHFSDLLIYLVVPAMIFNSYLTETDPALLRNLAEAFGLSAVLLLTGVVITFIVFARLRTQEGPIIRFACMFSNAAYMGFPLIQALFGSEGLLYASAYVTVFNILLWTIGYGMVSRKVHLQEMAHSIATTPVIWAMLAGMAVFFLQIPIPQVIRQPLSYIGNMNTPLSMLITGMLIAGCDLKKLTGRVQIPLIAVIRMLLIPGICFLIFYLLRLNSTVASIVLLLEACPCAAITSVFAVQFGFDEDLAAGSVVLTTFLSIVMLPLWAYLLTTVF
ncbi:MAG: AEC family transporter [Lachnospiraceae bacterium]|nr:AEC family transporter [Lachnospiraceae bacterium]